MPVKEEEYPVLNVTQVIPLGAKVALAVCRGDTLELTTDANLILNLKSNLTLNVEGDFNLSVSGKTNIVSKEDVSIDAVNGSTPKKIFLNSRMADQIKDLPSSIKTRQKQEEKLRLAFENQNKTEHLDFTHEELVELKKLLQERLSKSPEKE